MLFLAAADTLAGVASAASKLTCTISGDEVNTSTGADAGKVLYQGQLASSAATIYTVPATTVTVVKSIAVVNTDTVSHTFQLFRGGLVAANAITGTLTLPADYTAVWDDNGWHVYSDQGQQLGVGAAGATGAAGANGTNGTNGTNGVGVPAAGSTGQVLEKNSGTDYDTVWGNVLGLPLGLTGAVAATRYVGGTASVAPTSGTFAVGDFVITQAGSIYICTSAGSPGTWAAVSGAGASGGTPALTLGTANSAGSAGTFLRDDDTILVFDTTVPVTQAYSDAAAAGSAAIAARRDHRHGMPASGGGGGTVHPAPVQRGQNAAGASSYTITLGATPTNGNMLILVDCAQATGGTISGITQANVTWTQLHTYGANSACFCEVSSSFKIF